MSNLYSNIVELFKRVIIKTKEGDLFIFILLILITIPFANIFNSISIGILFAMALFFLKRNHIVIANITIYLNGFISNVDN